MSTFIFTTVFGLFSAASCSHRIEPGHYLLVENGNNNYVTISNDSFYLFRVNSGDIQSAENRDLIDRIGVGRYVLSGKYLNLYFDSTALLITDYSTDSLKISFSTDAQSKFVRFTIDLKFTVEEYGNNALIISSYKRDFFYPIKSQTLTVDFPDSIPIKAVRLGVMGFRHRVLPYDKEFNRFKFNYYFNDDKDHISQILGESWNFSILKRKPNSGTVFTFGNNGYLKKLEGKDSAYLNRLFEDNRPLRDLFKSSE